MGAMDCAEGEDTVEVVEPLLSIDLVGSTMSIDGGDIVYYTITVSHLPESPVAALEASEFKAAAAAAVEALPPRRREVYRLVREHGLSHERIADITGLSKQTVANHMSLALSDLRTMLRPFLNATQAINATSVLPATERPSRGDKATGGNG